MSLNLIAVCLSDCLSVCLSLSVKKDEAVVTKSATHEVPRYHNVAEILNDHSVTAPFTRILVIL